MLKIRQGLAALSLLTGAALLTGNVLAQGTEFTNIQRGRYLAQAGDCVSCHTVKGGKPFAGGYPLETPFGTIYSSNITPDVVTGIGNWTNDDFYRAMHSGIRKDGQPLYPACPYPWFTKMTREDIDAIRAYLNTQEPVRAISPKNELIWPLGWRRLVAVWNMLFFDEGEFFERDDKSPLWNRGAYLVNGAGHCAACHSEKNIFGATGKGPGLEGGDAGESWFAPSLTSHNRDGLGSWSTQDIVQYLSTGANENSASAGPMTEVVMNSTQHLSQEDLTAIATYLKDIPAHKAAQDRSDESIASEVMVRGEALYIDQCMGCHMAQGEGQKNAFPRLAGSQPVQAHKPQSLIQVVLGGDFMADPPALPSGLGMPSFAWKLDDQQVADLLTFIRNSWGNKAPAVSPDEVAKVRDALHEYGPRHKRLISQSAH